MVYSAGEIPELPLLQKHKQAPILGDPRYHGHYETKHVTPSKFRKHREEVGIS
jgi:hypothetical protein